MKDVLTLLRPRFLSFKNRGLSKTRKGRGLRILLLSTIGLAFWGGTFVILYRVLTYFQKMESFGDILAYKLLSMALITFFSLLIFSSILTSLSKLYLSKDLELVHSMPVPRGKIFLARWMESTLDSSWMVLIFSLPLFLSYGIVYKTGVFYYAMVSLNLLPFCLMASSLSVLAVMVVALLLPAGRIRGVFVFLGLFLVLLLVIVFRLIRPEKFVNPESLAPFILYLRTMDSSHSAWLPTTWFFDTLRASLTGAAQDAFFHSALSWSFAMSLIFITTWASGVIYFKGLSKAQVVPRRLFTSRRLKTPMEGFPFCFLSGPVRALTTKEIKVFLRDQTQWSQIFLVGALVAIYLYNFSVLPLEQSSMRITYLQNVLSFLNIALAAFVLAAVSARFVFPAVSQEGEAFWIVRSSPISIRTFLWIKFFVYFLPLLILSEVLIVVTNLLLHVTPLMMVLSVLTVFFMVPGIVSMGLGLGAMYPDFRAENPAQSVTSLGGLIYMTLSVGFVLAVIALEAGPVYSIFMSGVRRVGLKGVQWLWLVGSFSVVLILCLMALMIPMRLGEKKILESLES
jgi:ABC-2 type transport system permease protein